MIIEQAALDARREPIERTPAHRLALAWMAYAGLSEPWRTKKFWDLLGRAEGARRSDYQYLRDHDLGRCLNGWWIAAGVRPMDDWWNMKQRRKQVSAKAGN